MRYYCYNTVTPNANPRTLFHVLAPTNHRITIWGLDIGMKGSTPATAPVPLDWCIQSTAGTGSALAPQYQDRGIDDAKLATLTKDFTAEPTFGAILIEFPMHQQAVVLWRPPYPIIVKGGERVGLRYKSATFVPVTFTIYVEE